MRKGCVLDDCLQRNMAFRSLISCQLGSTKKVSTRSQYIPQNIKTLSLCLAMYFYTLGQTYLVIRANCKKNANIAVTENLPKNGRDFCCIIFILVAIFERLAVVSIKCKVS